MPKKGSNSKRGSFAHASAGSTSSKSANHQVKSSGRGKGEPLIVSDEDSQPDTVSVVSSVSDNRSVLEEGKFLIVKNT